MPVADIIRRTKSLRLRTPRSDLSNSGHSTTTTLATNFDNGRVVGNGDGELQEVKDLDYSKSHDWRPYLTRLSEEFFSSPVQHPHESAQGPKCSLPSSPIDIRSPEPLIGIALGNPEVDHEFIHEPEVRQGYPSDAAGSFNTSAAEPLGQANDEIRAGTAKPKDHMWAGFAGRFGIRNAAVNQSSVSQRGPKSPASPQPHSSNRQETSEPATLHASPEISNQYKAPPEWATSASYPRAMEQQPRMDKPKKSSPIRNVKPLRKLSWRRNGSRKSHAHRGSSPDLATPPSWPLSPLSPHVEEPQIIRNSSMKQNVSYSNRDGVSLLRVEIPHIEMERYSVMFANLLQAAEQPSLVTRRQDPLARIKLATQTRTQSLQRSKLPQPAQIMASPASSTVSSKPSTPGSPPVLVKSAARKDGLEGGPFPRRSATTTRRPLHLEKAYSDPTGPSHLVVMIHRPGDSQQRGETYPAKDFSARLLHPPGGTLAGSPTTKIHNSSTSSSTLILPQRSSSSSSPGLLLPRRASSLPTSSSPSPLRRNPPLSPQDAVQLLPISDDASPALLSSTTTSSANEISIARQISISKRPRRVLISTCNRKDETQVMTRGREGL